MLRVHARSTTDVKDDRCCRFYIVVTYYAVHAFAHVHTFAHFHRFGSIDTFQFTFLLKKKTIDKVTIIDKES